MFGKPSKKYDIPQEERDKYNYAKITTNKGVIWLKLFKDDAPNTVANFAHLAKEGFYNNLKFHRVIPGFMGTRWMSTFRAKWKPCKSRNRWARVANRL